MTVSTSLSSSLETIPLCVDLDGTLIASDLLVETLYQLVRYHPALLLQVPVWLMRDGRAGLKKHLAERCRIDAANLPYRREVIEFLQQKRQEGQPLVLATAAEETLATRVADHLQLFDEVLASDGKCNLKGQAKLDAINQRYPGGFDYMGDSVADCCLLAVARNAYLVAPPPKLLKWTRRSKESCQVLLPRSSRVFATIKLMRPHQWSKNALVALPLLFSHQLGDTKKLGAVVLAIMAFCLTASAVYAINDAVDVESDRRHRTKRRRPFASGRLPLLWAPALVVGLLAAVGAISCFLPFQFGLVLAGYFCLSLVYSLYLKTRLIVDVIVLAGLYTIRLFAGSCATQVVVSDWLLAFSVFMFTSLAFSKRFAEIHYSLSSSSPDGLPGRSYRQVDLQMIGSIGSSCGLIAVLILALYIHSENVRALYHSPSILFLICPILLYWITRIWFFANRGKLDEDSISFAAKDRISWVALLLCALIVIVAALM